MPKNLQAIVLAGGKSIRFNTEKTKLAEKICGKEMILYPLELLKTMNIPTTVVVGFQKEKIINIINHHALPNINIAYQIEQIGSGNAVACSKDFWAQDHILIINGDIPLLTQDVIEKLYAKHITGDADISFATSHLPDDDSDSYCRILINDTKFKVVEGRDETTETDAHCCMSAGIYIIKKTFLANNIDTLSLSPITKEYYLPELIEIASDQGCKIITMPISFDLARGVNTLAELWVVEHIKRSQIISHWMNLGVRFSSSLNVIIDTDVILEPGVFVGSAAHILGKTVIERNATIGAFSYIENSIIEQNATIKSHVVILDSNIGRHATINSFQQIAGQQIKSGIHQHNITHPHLFTGARKDDIEFENFHAL